MGAGQFTTLAKALTAAGLIDTLKGPGPFTVFAPTDAAFAKIPPAQLDALLANKAQLIKVLTYHVVPGKVVAADVKTGQVKTVEGDYLNVRASAGGVKVNDANVVKTDILASNGIIHVIDTVVIPNLTTRNAPRTTHAGLRTFMDARRPFDWPSRRFIRILWPPADARTPKASRPVNRIVDLVARDLQSDAQATACK